MTSPNYKSSPVSGPNTPLTTPLTNPTPVLTNPPKEPDLIEVKLPSKPLATPTYNPNTSDWVHGPPPLPPKPKGGERRLDTSPPPPPLPPRQGQPPLPPRTTPTRGVLESRSPHMDPVEPRRENSHLFAKTTQSPPPAVVPRRHSHIVNGSQMGKDKAFFKKLSFNLFSHFT